MQGDIIKFSTAGTTNYHNLSGLKEHTFIPYSSEVRCLNGSAGLHSF